MKLVDVKLYKISILKFIDIIILPLVTVSIIILKKIRKIGVYKFPLSKKIFLKIGAFPIIDHYYEPLFNVNKLEKSLRNDRLLPGIMWNIEEQLNILSSFNYNDEQIIISNKNDDDYDFYFGNNAFEAGDAEYFYNIIRFKKPKKIVEIGSGYSTLIALKATQKNAKEISNNKCNITCIEPYENSWLEKINIILIRKKVEELDKNIFLSLENNDILFIDSSHIIRPQGDVLFEILEILPVLNKGVIVQFHDIFSPKDYLDNFLKKQIRFWNEQYLLEAFLTSNNEWKIIGALNFLHHNYYDRLKRKCIYLNPENEPGSFYIQRK